MTVYRQQCKGRCGRIIQPTTGIDGAYCDECAAALQAAAGMLGGVHRHEVVEARLERDARDHRNVR